MNKSILILFFTCILSTMTAQNSNPEEIVQGNLEAYNERDLDRFMADFSEDIVMYSGMHGEVFATGKEEVRSVYGKLFAASPELHSKILKRIVLGNTVIDHEFITGRNGSNKPLELVLIYEVENEKIVRTTAIRE